MGFLLRASNVNHHAITCYTWKKKTELLGTKCISCDVCYFVILSKLNFDAIFVVVDYVYHT